MRLLPAGRGRPGGHLVVLLAALAIAALACSSDEERALDHLRRGIAYRAEGRDADARLEFHNALRFDPTGPYAHSELARLELHYGNVAAAIIYIRKAHRLAPEDARSAIALAMLIQADEPERARELINGVVERQPGDAVGYIARSNLSIARGNTRAALAAANRAIEVEPTEPYTDWQLGTALQAMILEGQLTDTAVPDAVFQRAFQAFAQYIQKGGELPWRARIEQARVTAAWPARGQHAASEYRAALDATRQANSPIDLQRAAVLTASYARGAKNNSLLRHALELLVELEPRDFDRWRDLADVRERAGEDPSETWKELLSLLPEDPKAHTLYARFLISQWKLDEALDYLRKKADEGVGTPVLLSAISATQLAAGRIEDASETASHLEKEYPNHPRAVLGRAQVELRRGMVEHAVDRLRAATQESADYDLLVLLTMAEITLGEQSKALMTVKRAIESQPTFAHEAESLRARLLADTGKFHLAIRNLERIEERARLTFEDRALLAHCYYETLRPRRGRRMLEALLHKRRVPAAAVLAYARREGGKPAPRARAVKKLDELLGREPRNWEALRLVTLLDLEDGHLKPAWRRLDRYASRAGDAAPTAIRMLAARVLASGGDEAKALQQVRTLFEAHPRAPGPLEFLTTLLLRQSQVDEALAAVLKARSVRPLSVDERLLLGRLYRMKGRDSEAAATLRKAIEKDGVNPSLYYHMGMALRALHREDEASAALEKALSISQTFPEADHARRALAGGRGAGAS